MICPLELGHLNCAVSLINIFFTGLMKLADLKHIFKPSIIGASDSRGYIVNLLNKFEVALTWDNCTLLIPSLLPSEEDLYAPFASPAVRVKVSVKHTA